MTYAGARLHRVRLHKQQNAEVFKYTHTKDNMIMHQRMKLLQQVVQTVPKSNTLLFLETRALNPSSCVNLTRLAQLIFSG